MLVTLRRVGLEARMFLGVYAWKMWVF